MKNKFQQIDGWIKLIVNKEIYSLQTIYSAGYVFMDKAYLYLDMEGDQEIAIWLKPKEKDVDLNILGCQFMEELLNYAHYFSSLEKNAETTKLLLQRALFSAAPSLVHEAEDEEIQALIKELEEEEKKKESKEK